MCSGPVGRSPVRTRYRAGCFAKSSRRARDRRSASSNVPGLYSCGSSLIDYYDMHAISRNASTAFLVIPVCSVTEFPADFEPSPDAYKVKLDTFEGPLDLLLYLIRKNEVNIYDIPISLITEQYLGYIELMQELNLDVAGEFLVMAATLIHMKSRTLLPRPETSAESGE